jgi:hypothetical protein
MIHLRCYREGRRYTLQALKAARLRDARTRSRSGRGRAAAAGDGRSGRRPRLLRPQRDVVRMCHNSRSGFACAHFTEQLPTIQQIRRNEQPAKPPQNLLILLDREKRSTRNTKHDVRHQLTIEQFQSRHHVIRFRCQCPPCFDGPSFPLSFDQSSNSRSPKRSKISFWKR